ncbi:MAG: hypothetical protein LBD06_13390 [Candidatus Accumulibacter sp.]|jgi:hypothetical protein|nr:hypothetical protein [Accumulibacter sp.]
MRISFDGSGRPQSLVARIVGAVLGVLAFGVAVAFSVFVFVGLALAGLMVWGGFCWKTRALRRTMREERRARRDRAPAGDRPGRSGGAVIEGEAVRVSEDRG